MPGAVLEGLGKVGCSEYWLYRTGFCFGAASRREGHQRSGEGDLVSRPPWASVSLCETGVLVYIVSSSTCNFRILGLGGPGGLGLREAGVAEGKVNGAPLPPTPEAYFQAPLGSGLSGVCVCVCSEEWTTV